MLENLIQKTNNLRTQQKRASDYLHEIDSMLDNWQIQEDGLVYLTVIDNVDDLEQEYHVQELIMIDRSISKLVLYIEKMELMLEKNERLVNKVLIRIKQEQLTKTANGLNLQLKTQKEKALKIKDNLKMLKASL